MTVFFSTVKHQKTAKRGFRETQAAGEMRRGYDLTGWVSRSVNVCSWNFIRFSILPVEGERFQLAVLRILCDRFNSIDRLKMNRVSVANLPRV